MYACMHVCMFVCSFVNLCVCLHAFLPMFVCARVFACVNTLHETDSGAREREQRKTFMKRQTPWGCDPMPY